jgi:tetratricopeptide (TPR) repeat protein
MISCPTCGRDAPDTAVSCVVCATPLPHIDTTGIPTTFGTPQENETFEPATGHDRTGTAATTGLVPGQTFGHRYQVIRLLGAGGMGAVYHVWDAELSLPVALKVIRPDPNPSARQELERRFKRELVLARQVTHSNVIRIHDLGEIEGIKYITMPFVPGTDLAHLLKAQGRLPVPRALALARQIVSGLRAAHEAGIVHRDLKPANILIDDAEKAILTDFGIARSIEAGTLATATGAVIGTLAYMAPEQAMGKPVDQRADIYAFGLIVSEMLVEKRGPIQGETALALLIERSKQAPPRLRSIDPSIPDAIDRIVAKCVEPDPEARYQTTKALEADLDRLDANGHERADAVAPAPPPSRRWVLVAGVAALVAALGLAGWVSTRPGGTSTVPAAPRDPVSVLIADFDNQAKEPVFEGSLEQALNIAIEGASFITSYSRAGAQALATQMKLGPELNESAARLVAVREGIKIVMTGAVATRGSGYQLTVKAVDPSNGNTIATAETAVSDKASVLRGVETVASRLRDALGDTTPESARRAAAETVTAASLEALQTYSIAQDLASAGRSDEAIAQYRKAIELDPNFGRAYSGWATELYNNGRRDEAAEQYKKALALSDRMTEREKYRTQGSYFLGPGASYEQAVSHYEELVKRYPADRAGRNNLGLAYFHLLDFDKAKEQALRALEIYPSNTRFRQNYALYAMYAGDFKTAADEAEKVLAQSQTQYKVYLVRAAAAFAGGNLQGMKDAYAQMAARGGAAGASLSNHGLADLAMYEGRTAEAIAILREGIAADEKSNNRSARAAKLALLGEAQLASGETGPAVGSAREAIALSRDDVSLVPAAFVLLNADRVAEAKAIAESLGQQFQARSRAYAEMIEAGLSRKGGRLNESVDALGRARKLSDLWFGRFMLGTINVEASRHLLAQPDLELCLKRRGEATALFLDDVPSFRYLAPLNYWLGRAQEGQQNATAAADSYRAFLLIRGADSADPLAADARKRLQTLSASAGAR